MGVELSTPLVVSYSYILRDENKGMRIIGISVIYVEFITSLSILKGSVNIN